MKIIIICLFISSSLLAQIGVAPLKPGNRWVYNSYLAGDYSRSYPFQFEVIDSTKIINGITFYAVIDPGHQSFAAGYYGITPNQFFARYDTIFSDSLYAYFKMDPQKGDTWENDGIYNTIIDTFTAKVFNKYTLIYVIDRDAGLASSREYWTKEYGMLDGLYEQEEDILSGCVIDGILYGDTTVTGIEEVKKLLGKFILYQNYPNPFNPTTTITYQLPKDGVVTLKIYDILGRKVKTLVNEYKPAGRYDVTFNASNLASGVYIYQLKSGDFVANKKLILMK